MPEPRVSNRLIRLTKMFDSLFCFRSVSRLEENPVLGFSRLVASTILLSALLTGVAVRQVHAQDDICEQENPPAICDWADTGTVAVSTDMLTIREGESMSYSMWLTQPPLADGWWVRIHVNGVVYTDGNYDNSEGIGISWVPSVGHQFNQGDSTTPWRTVSITAFQDEDDEDEFVTITHEGSDENFQCPPSLHGVAPVRVRVIDDEGDGVVTPPVEPPVVEPPVVEPPVVEPPVVEPPVVEPPVVEPPVVEPPVVEPPQMDIGDAQVSEGGLATFPVTLSAAATATVTVLYATVDGTATAADLDYEAASGMLTFDVGDSTGQVEVQTLQDEEVEGTETFTVQLSAAEGATIADATGEGRITDDETPTTGVTLLVNPMTVSEEAGGTPVMVTAALNGAALSGSTVVTVAVGQTGDSATEGTDYETVNDLTVTILGGSTSTTETFTLTPIDDETAEGDETISVTGTTSAPGLTVTPTALRIIDNETAPPPGSTKSRTVWFGSSSYHVREGMKVEVTVHLSLESIGRLQIPLTVKNGLGTSVQDHVGVPGSVVFEPGETVAKFIFKAMPDDLDEETERVTLGFGMLPPSVNVGFPATAEVSIADERRGVKITPIALEVMEGGRETYTVVLKSEPTGTVTVRVGGAAGDVTVAPESLLFTPSNWSMAQTVTVTAAEDEDELEDEPVKLTHTVSGGGYAGVIAPDVTVTVLENDLPALSIEDAEATEGDGEISFAVTMDRPSSRTVRVEWATADGTATADEDYTGRRGELEFAPGETRKEAKVPLLDDVMLEPAETLTVALSNPQGVTLERAEATGVIQDNDFPMMSISAVSGSVEEGEDVRFALVRSGDFNVQLSVMLRVSPTGAFLSTTPPTTVSFEPGDVRVVLKIGTTDDDRDEPDGTLEAVLVESDDYDIEGPGRAVVTVTDNDHIPSIGIEGARALESAGEIVFPVTLGAASDRVVTVEWSTSEATARQDEDYRGEQGVVTFPPGGTAQTIRVALLDDMLLEEDETFTLTLASAVNGTLDGGTATGVIGDDESTVFKAWLTRFGRTVAGQVVDTVSERLTGVSRRSSQVTIAGQQLQSAFKSEADDPLGNWQLPFGNQRLMPVGGLGAPGPLSRAGESLGLYRDPLEGSLFGTQRLSGRNLLATSSFHLSSQDENGSGNRQGAGWAAWGRGVATQFSGRETDLSLDGGVVTGLVGVDYERGPMLAGMAVSRSNGDGDFFAGRGQRLQSQGAELSSSVTSVYPYVRADLREQLFVWGLYGQGWGEMTASGEAGVARHDIRMRMGAVGARGLLLQPEQAKGFELAMKSDTFLVGMGTESDAGPRVTDADASRVRLLLEGSRDGLAVWGGELESSVEFGIRRDAGAAETGMGLELGGSLRYVNPDRGLAVSVTARRLMAHQDDDYREWGVGGTVEYDPGTAGRGLSVRMVSSWGTAASGTNRLWSQSPSAGFPSNGYASFDAPLSAEMDYRILAFGGRLQMAPYADVSLGGAGSRAHPYLLGWRLQFGPNIRLQFDVGLGDGSYSPLSQHGLMGPGSMPGSW